MRRAPLATVLACIAISSAAAQRPPVMQPIPSGKPPPLGDSGPSAAERAYASGTGFVVADRRLLTNRHVVADCARLVIRTDAGARLPAQLVASDRERDLALLSTELPAGPPLVFRDEPAVRRGETVVVYGFPLHGLLSSGPTLETGNINALAGLRDNANDFQISAAVQPGNSGGPLFDSRAHVVGVVVSKLNAARVAEMTGGDIPQNVNFAIKGAVALQFLRANNVQPMTAPSTGAERRPEEIDAVANPSTVYLQCFR